MGAGKTEQFVLGNFSKSSKVFVPPFGQNNMGRGWGSFSVPGVVDKGLLKHLPHGSHKHITVKIMKLWFWFWKDF